MSTPVTIALIVFAVSAVVGLTLATIRGLDAWRALRRFQRNAAVPMQQMSTLISQVEARTAGVGESAARLERAQAQLQESLAEAGVIAGAAGELHASYRRVRKFMPRT